MSFKQIKIVLLMSLLALPLAAAENEETFTLNFKDADIQSVIKFIADATGKTIIINPKVRGSVKVISNSPVNKEELYALFLSVLDVHGFTAIENGNVVRIVPNRDARSLAIPSVNATGAIDDTYMTQVIQLQNISAAKLLPIVRPLVPQHGHISAYDPSNALIITDTRANIARLQKIIAQIDTAAVLSTELIELRYAQADAVVKVVKELEKVDAKSGNVSKPVILVADARINAVLVHGDDMQRMRVKRLLKRLDRPKTTNSNVRVIYLKYANAENVAKILGGVMQNMQRTETAARTGGAGGGVARGRSSRLATSIQSDEDTNAILITADSDTMESLLVLVESLDIRRAQVLIEAIIVEVAEDDSKELGIDWVYSDKDHGFGGSNFGIANSFAAGATTLDADGNSLASVISGIAATTGGIFGIGRLGGQTDFLGMLRFIKANKNTNVLSTPSLLTTDNHMASISVGENVPFVTGSFASTGGGGGNSVNPFQTVERKDVGILLEVTPHVNDGDTVVLDISQEISSVVPNTGQGLITRQRKIETQVMAKSGEIIVLGGLITDDVAMTETRVPILGDIPILGNLFRSQTNTKRKTNLMIFIRATIVPNDEMLLGATAEKYAHIRDAMLDMQDNNAGILRRAKDIPMLPEWEEQLIRVQDKYKIEPESNSETAAPVED